MADGEGGARRGRKYEQVLEGARAIFVRDGFEGASVDDVARAKMPSQSRWSWVMSSEMVFIGVSSLAGVPNSPQGAAKGIDAGQGHSGRIWNATVGIAFTEDVIPLISALEQRFTSYDIDQIAKLKSKYAIRLYEIVIAWRSTNKTPVYELNDFRNKLGLDVTEYKTMSNFNINVLNIAMQQINKFTDIKIKVNKHKKGVKIVGFSFEITQRKLKHQNSFEPSTADIFYKLTDPQINMFGNQLSRLDELSYLAVGNESYEALASKIKEMLRDSAQQKQFQSHLKNLGFKP